MAKQKSKTNHSAQGAGAHSARPAVSPQPSSSNGAHGDRVEVLKTYKLYIGGEFPRSESGRYYTPGPAGKALANVCLGSRKDFREAVLKARSAQDSWADRTAFNRSQILYRIGEMLEGRKAQFIEELTAQGLSAASARAEVFAAIDRMIYYAGWCDKYVQVMSSVNPVASSHFDFSMPEPVGVVVALAPEESPLAGLVSLIAPIIAGGNSCIVLASEQRPLSAVSFAEVLNSSDLPGGVVNILTGRRSELLKPMATHMDVNAIVHSDGDANELKTLQELAALNVKRIISRGTPDWTKGDATENPYWIMDTQEIKTTWHPVEGISAAGSKY